MSGDGDRHLDLVRTLTRAFGAELDSHRPDDAIAWPPLPRVDALVRHLGSVHRWVTTIVRSGSAGEREPAPPMGWDATRDWFADGGAELVGALTEVGPDEPCWIVGGSVGRADFWRRRMVFENVKHLIDLRAAGGGIWRTADELSASDYADGIDELFSVFVPRSRADLPRLPCAIDLVAVDLDRMWRIETDWTLGDPAGPAAAGRVSARTGDLALALWERADPGAGDERFAVDGEPGAISALAGASVHPWSAADRIPPST